MTVKCNILCILGRLFFKVCKSNRTTKNVGVQACKVLRIQEQMGVENAQHLVRLDSDCVMSCNGPSIFMPWLTLCHRLSVIHTTQFNSSWDIVSQTLLGLFSWCTELWGATEAEAKQSFQEPLWGNLLPRTSDECSKKGGIPPHQHLLHVCNGT